MAYQALALARDPDGDWSGRDQPLDDVEDLDAAVELLRDRYEGDTVLLLVEEDDEWVAVVRVEPEDRGTDHDVRAFLSDARVVSTSDLAGRLLGEAVLGSDGSTSSDDEESDDADSDDAEVESDTATDTLSLELEPAGDAGLLDDLGLTAAALVALCVDKGSLPSDVIAGVAEAVGAGELLERIRPA